jgi:hypothetical protein
VRVNVDSPRFRARGRGHEDGRVEVDVEPKEVEPKEEVDREEAGAPPEEETPAAPGPSVRQFSLRELEDGRVQLDVRYVGRDGQTKERSFTGTRREVGRQLRELPPHVARPAERLLFELGPGRDARPRRFRMHLQPSIGPEGEGSLQIQIVRPGQDGETRVFNLDGFLAPGGPGGVRGNLDIEVLRQELDELEPQVRVQVQEALRRFQVPELHVDVETSQ